MSMTGWTYIIIIVCSKNIIRKYVWEFCKYIFLILECLLIMIKRKRIGKLRATFVRFFLGLKAPYSETDAPFSQCINLSIKFQVNLPPRCNVFISRINLVCATRLPPLDGAFFVKERAIRKEKGAVSSFQIFRRNETEGKLLANGDISHMSLE